MTGDEKNEAARAAMLARDAERAAIAASESRNAELREALERERATVTKMHAERGVRRNNLFIGGLFLIIPLAGLLVRVNAPIIIPVALLVLYVGGFVASMVL